CPRSLATTCRCSTTRPAAAPPCSSSTDWPATTSTGRGSCGPSPAASAASPWTTATPAGPPTPTPLTRWPTWPPTWRARRRPPSPMPPLAAAVAGLLRALDLPPAHLVGLSLGGMIAQEVALAHPARVRSLFLVGTLARADDWFNATLDVYGHIRRQVPDTPAFF